MSVDFAAANDTALNQLRRQFEAKGYRFEFDPRGDQLPDSLRSRSADAIAISQDGRDKVVIEIKHRQKVPAEMPASDVDSDGLAKDGWRYLLVYFGQDPDSLLELGRPQKHQVDDALEEVRSLEKAGYLRAAMLEGWSLLEAAARRAHPDGIRVVMKPLSPAAIVEQLAMDGQINDAEAKRLRILSSIRNAIAHGDLSISVSRDDLSYLLERVESVNAAMF